MSLAAIPAPWAQIVPICGHLVTMETCVDRHTVIVRHGEMPTEASREFDVKLAIDDSLQAEMLRWIHQVHVYEAGPSACGMSVYHGA